MILRTVPVLLGAMAAASALVAQPLFIETVPVGDPGNAADTTGFGSVAYEYQIGRYEVTNAEYAAFLNAVAATDSFNLYSTFMSSDARGGITRAGSSGSYSYSVKPGYENMPVVFVTFWDAARFSNWLGTGFTEGRDPLNPSVLLPGAAYDTNFVANPDFAAGNRLAGASVFLPSENEWYKAAYFHPQSAGGPSDNYWLYATRSDTQPASRQPAPFPNSANYLYNDGIDNGINGGYAVTQAVVFPSGNALTAVGAYGPDSQSYFGTADQSGNVREWSDSVHAESVRRVARGGSWINPEGAMQSSSQQGSNPELVANNVGFRVASLAPIPEPGTVGAIAGLVALGGALVLRRGRGRL